MTSPAEPVPPFGATVAGVLALVPEAKLITAADRTAGRFGVTADDVLEWLAGLSARVSRTLDGWEQLEAVTTDDADSLPDRALLIAEARDAVHNGAASYLEAARYPERAGRAGTSYDTVLWARFERILEELYAWLRVRVDTGEAGAELAGGGAPSLAYSFPEASFTPGRLTF